MNRARAVIVNLICETHMNLNYPTVAFTLAMVNTSDGPWYCVYRQGYGLEMMMDDEWPINTIVMVPPHLVDVLTRSAKIQSAGAIAGASYTPGDGDFRQILDNKGRWVLTRRSDDVSKIVASGLGILFYVEGDDHLADVDTLLANDGLTETNVMIAFQSRSTSTLETISKSAIAIHSKLVGRNIGRAHLLVSASIDNEELIKYLSLPKVSGLLLLDVAFGNVIDLLQQVAGLAHGSAKAADPSESET